MNPVPAVVDTGEWAKCSGKTLLVPTSACASLSSRDITTECTPRRPSPTREKLSRDPSHHRQSGGNHPSIVKHGREEFDTRISFGGFPI